MFICATPDHGADMESPLRWFTNSCRILAAMQRLRYRLYLYFATIRVRLGQWFFNLYLSRRRAELADADLDNLWRWAIMHWDRSRLPRCRFAAAPAGY